MARTEAQPGAPAWPAAVFDAAVLRGLDARARGEIIDAGRLRRVAAGEILYRAGESGTSFFVVASGRVALRAVRRGDDRESDLREAGAGELFGEEATVAAARRATAVAIEPGHVAEIPVHVFRRAAGRSGKAEVAEKLERILRRSATRDLLRTLAFTRDLPEDDIDRILDAVRYHPLARGEYVYRQGETAADLWLVGDGMVQLQTDVDDRLHIRAYLTRGDFFGDAEIAARTPRATSAVASGASLLLSIPARVVQTLSDRSPDLLPRLRRVAEGQHAAQQAIVGGAAKNATQHVFRDLYRLQVARSLLVIDLETCVRCGHCAWACSELYGTARLVRRGDKMVARAGGDVESTAPQSLMLPNSCQHCENPACMPDCPTGAIGRDPQGDVFIREELCTGCGACAKACPWDNIQMGARPIASKKPSGGEYPEIAVKCDLCRTFESGPACVQSCPTSSIFRLNPSEELADVRDLLGGGRPAEIRAAPARYASWIGGAAVAAVAIGAVGSVMQGRGLWAPDRGLGYAAGVAAAVGFVMLLLYAVPKRGVRLWMRRRGKLHRRAEIAGEKAAPVTSRVRPHAALHLAVGLLTMGLAAAHVPSAPSAGASTGSALLLAFVLSAAAGIGTALAYRIVPSRLARLERTAALPEDFRAAQRELLDRLYREVSGRSELVKKIFEKILLPYAKAPLGGITLLATGRGLRAEESAVRARVDQVLDGRGAERLAGLQELIRIVVEHRALPAQRWLQRLLRAGLPAHVVTSGVALALLVLHIVATRYR